MYDEQCFSQAPEDHEEKTHNQEEFYHQHFNLLPLDTNSKFNVNNIIYKCESCSAYLPGILNLIRHLGNIHEIPVQLTIDSKLTLDKAIATNSIESYDCENCLASLRDISDFKRHLENVHAISVQLLLEESSSSPLQESLPNDFSSSSSQPIAEAVSPNHLLSQPVLSTNDEGHWCPWCSRNYKYRVNLLSHIRKKHPDKKLEKCPTCRRIFFEKSELEEHLPIHIPKTYLCPYCEYTTHKRWNFSIHIKRHPE